MKKAIPVSLLLILFLSLFVGTVSAQGAIQGVVHEDINGDGVCVDSGVAGEVPVADVDVEFVSSDEQTVLTMYSSPDGAFGIFAAGFSYWKLTAKPSTEWVVTSKNPIYAPIDKDHPAIAGLFFCVQKASKAKVLLPQSGNTFSTGTLTGTAVFGIGILLMGLILEKRRRSI